MTRCVSCFAVPPELPSPGRGQARVEPPRTCLACGADLPPDQAGRTCVTMAGATNSGKTVFIAVMIEQLRQHLDQCGTSVRPAEHCRALYRREYLEPLYKLRGKPGPTPSAGSAGAYQKEPLDFVLTTEDKQVHHLLIRDVAGEDLSTEDSAPRQDMAYFRHADAVFFLYDPMRVPEIVSTLRGLVDEQPDLRDAEHDRVFETVERLVEPGRPKFAAIMAKFDILQSLKDNDGAGWLRAVMGNAGSAMFRDPGSMRPSGGSRRPALDPQEDAEQLNEEVRSLLLSFGGTGALEARFRQMPHLKYFAVSALGANPDGDRLDAHGITPYRCLDPLRWVLAGTGLL